MKRFHAYEQWCALEASIDFLLELEGLELEELEDSNIPIIFMHNNFYICVYIFLCALEVSNKNLLELEGLELEYLEDSNSFQSSNAHHCIWDISRITNGKLYFWYNESPDKTINTMSTCL